MSSEEDEREPPEAPDTGERLDEPDREGHMTAPSGDSEAETRED
jgi:hypothetical protein